MRASLVVALLAMTALAGCSSNALDCPDEYGQQYEDLYVDIADRLEEAGTPVPDADRDCVADPVETQLGTDPNSASSYPTLQQLADAGSNVPGLGNNTVEAPKVYKWETKTATGSFTTSQVLAPGATGAVTAVTVPTSLYTYVNFTVTSTAPAPVEVSIRLDPPGCASQTGCDGGQTKATSGGEVSFDLGDAPASGSWTVSFFATTGAFDGSFSADIASLVLVKAASSTTAAPPA